MRHNQEDLDLNLHSRETLISHIILECILKDIRCKYADCIHAGNFLTSRVTISFSRTYTPWRFLVVYMLPVHLKLKFAEMSIVFSMNLSYTFV
jgi:hypothetical protein